MIYSFIIPVYNRPLEVEELLESFTNQTYRDFEVIIVEDGSDNKCDKIVHQYQNKLNIIYYFKENSGPALSRNYGAARSVGEYLIFLDSDCIIPSDYLCKVNDSITKTKTPSYGGPDRAHPDFTKIQKAINYSMTSFITTGGIRGGKKRLEKKFYPRTFNLGVDKKVFISIGGFSDMRFGEDIDFSIRIYKSGYYSRLIPEAWVFHKRRTDLRKFFKQIFNSGIARFSLSIKHPESLKTIHLLPSVFAICSTIMIVAGLFTLISFIPLLTFALIVFVDSFVKYKNIPLSIICIQTSFIQLFSYGCGFIYAALNYVISNKKSITAFEKTFYK